VFAWCSKVKNKSSAVLLSEILQLVKPGTRILTDALRSYRPLHEYGFLHDVVVHKKEFVSSTDSSVHTQNIEGRNRWTKNAIRSYGNNRRLNSYCSEYAYRYDTTSSVRLRIRAIVVFKLNLFLLFIVFCIC